VLKGVLDGLGNAIATIQLDHLVYLLKGLPAQLDPEARWLIFVVLRHAAILACIPGTGT
jgi:hypothetical protein